MDLSLKTPIAILGYGAEGRYAYDFLRREKIYDVTLCDAKQDLLLPKNVKTRLGPDAFADLSGFKTIIRSPGVHYRLPGIRAAKKAGAAVLSLTGLTMKCASKRVTAITGSNGKTTTTALTATILRTHYGQKLIVGGNDGQPVLKEALSYPDSPILLESSSFQFADVGKSPHIAVVLNITPNHFDWHVNMKDYVRAKSNLLRYQKAGDWAVLNANDENSAKLAAETSANIFWIGARRGGNYALWRNGKLILHTNRQDVEIIDRGALTLKTHPDNLLFATAIGSLHGVPVSTIAEQLRQFRGVPQRLEYVRTLRDIHFYNDSSCTTPESAEIAIGQFDPKKLILMLGGSSKNADFSFLAAKIVQQGVRVYLYGKEGERVEKALIEAGGSFLILCHDKTGDFRHVVENVYALAQAEDNIVLSPACASFDMFQNSKERGYRFTELVGKLA